jgi:hypothetical protein
MTDRSSPADLARSAAMMGNQNARKTASVDARSDPRKVMRLTETERALIEKALGHYAEEYASVDELEPIAEIMRRMS